MMQAKNSPRLALLDWMMTGMDGVGTSHLLARLAAIVYAIHAGHHPIEQGESGGVFRLQNLPSLHAILDRNHFVAGPAQQRSEHPARDGIVLGNQNLHRGTS